MPELTPPHTVPEGKGGGIKGGLTKKLGPLPAWAWIGIGGVGIWILMSRGGGRLGAGSGQFAQSGGGGGGGGIGPIAPVPPFSPPSVGGAQPFATMAPGTTAPVYTFSPAPAPAAPSSSVIPAGPITWNPQLATILAPFANRAPAPAPPPPAPTAFPTPIAAASPLPPPTSAAPSPNPITFAPWTGITGPGVPPGFTVPSVTSPTYIGGGMVVQPDGSVATIPQPGAPGFIGPVLPPPVGGNKLYK